MELSQGMARQERAIKRFLRDFLDKPRDGRSFDHILARAGRYYDADRAYIFELNAERTRIRSTYAWRREGIPAQSVSLQEIEPGEFLRWFEAHGEDGEVYLCEKTAEQNPEVRAVLEARGLSGLLAAPMVEGGAVVGLLGVDNPRKNTEDLLLLSVVASACHSEIVTLRAMETRMETTSRALMDRTRVIQSLGEIYTSMYYIDMATGRFTELSALSDVHAHIGTSGDARERLG